MLYLQEYYNQADCIVLAGLPPPKYQQVLAVIPPPECQQVFALIVRTNQELKERLLTFTLASDDASQKATFLNALTRTVANVICRSDVVSVVSRASSAGVTW